MEKLNKRLTDKQNTFFNDLSIYIDQPIYFFGSINRIDYFPGKSDIDVVIFTDNESYTIQMLCNFLNIKRNEIRKSIYRIDSTIVRGYKAIYKDNNIEVEIAIYNNKHKTIVLDDNNKCSNLPLYIYIILIIVKFFYYNLSIIPQNIYRKIKLNLMNPDGKPRFIVVDI